MINEISSRVIWQGGHTDGRVHRDIIGEGQLRVWRICERCRGDGDEPGDWGACVSCKGSGRGRCLEG